MFARLIQLLLVLGVILGLVLPKASAALAQLGVTDSRVVLICTGQGMQEIRLSGTDDATDPMPARDRGPQAHDLPCLLIAAPDAAMPVAQPLWLRLALADPLIPEGDLWRTPEAPSEGFARAPPRG
jgi:hypothetical protein